MLNPNNLQCKLFFFLFIFLHAGHCCYRNINRHTRIGYLQPLLVNMEIRASCKYTAINRRQFNGWGNGDRDWLLLLSFYSCTIIRSVATLLPYRTLATRIHWRARRTIVGISKFVGIGQRSQNTYRSRRVYWRTDLRQSIFWSHCSAPDLCVVEKKQLIVTHI